MWLYWTSKKTILVMFYNVNMFSIDTMLLQRKLMNDLTQTLQVMMKAMMIVALCDKLLFINKFFSWLI